MSSLLAKIYKIATTLFFILSTHNAAQSAQIQSDIALAEMIQQEEKTMLALNHSENASEYLQIGDIKNAYYTIKKAFNSIGNAPIVKTEKLHISQKFIKITNDYLKKLIAEGNIKKAKNISDEIFINNNLKKNKQFFKIRQSLNQKSPIYSAISPKHIQNTQEIKYLIKIAHSQLQLADLDKAENTINKILNIDPTNKAARIKLKKINSEKNKYSSQAYLQTREKLLSDTKALWQSPINKIEIPISETTNQNSPNYLNKPITNINEKIKNIVFEKIQFNNTELQEIVTYLTTKSAEYDSNDRSGVNIIINDDSENNFSSKLITFSASNMPLSEILRYITQLADMKLKIENYAVILLPITQPTTNIITKKWRVPPNFLPKSDTPINAKEFLTENGISFPSGTSAFLNKRTNLLTVTNSTNNIDLVDVLVTASRSSFKQIRLNLTIIKIASTKLKELGFDSTLGQFNIGNSTRNFASGGTIGNQRDINSFPNTEFPLISQDTGQIIGQNLISSGLRSGTNALPQNSLQSILLNNQIASASPLAPATFSIAGVFTDPQYQLILRTLKQQSGNDIVQKPSILIKPGESAIIKNIQEFIYPTEYDTPQIPQSFGNQNTSVTNTNVNTNQVTDAVRQFPIIPSNPTAFETKEIGTFLNANASLNPDNKTITLQLNPKLIEFIGFINYGSDITLTTSATQITGSNDNLQVQENQILQPVFKTTESQHTVSIWDGHTIAIAGLLSSKIDTVNDSVPILSKIPILGKLFKSKSTQHIQENLIIFASVNLIDPAGNKINN